jgi:hypothetical protein
VTSAFLSEAPAGAPGQEPFPEISGNGYHGVHHPVKILIENARKQVDSVSENCRKRFRMIQ